MSRLICFAIALALSTLGAVASPLGPDGTAGRTLPGKFIWLDLASENPASARAFYGAVFGFGGFVGDVDHVDDLRSRRDVTALRAALGSP